MILTDQDRKTFERFKRLFDRGMLAEEDVRTAYRTADDPAAISAAMNAEGIRIQGRMAELREKAEKNKPD